MSQPGKALPLAERWEQDEQMLAENPLKVDVQPRWIADNLPQYGPDAPLQPSADDLSADDL